jgi:hypothetical protein
LEPVAAAAPTLFICVTTEACQMGVQIFSDAGAGSAELVCTVVNLFFEAICIFWKSDRIFIGNEK